VTAVDGFNEVIIRIIYTSMGLTLTTGKSFLNIV
jgi:hypothetical protein